MTTYLLHLGHGVSRTIQGDSPTELAQAVHRHARGVLGSTRVDVRLDPDTLTGSIVNHGAAVNHFTLIADEEPPPPPPPTDGIRWGWTLADLDSITRIAITRNPWYQAVDTDERYAAGWHAAVELLYTATTPPARHDLIRAAWAAADSYTCRSGTENGIPRQRGESYTGRTDLPRWHAYWDTVCRHTPSPENPIVERTALAQIWPRLTPAQQEALQALAAHSDYQHAADALELSYSTFFRRVSSARQRVLALWWEGETPRRGWRDRRPKTEARQLHSVSAHIRKRRRSGAA